MLQSLFSKQKWLIQRISSDKLSCDDLIRECLFKILVHFIEDEQGLEKNYWIEDDEHDSVKDKLMSCYIWITQDRDVFIAKLRNTSKEFPEIPENDTLIKFLTETYIQDVSKLHQELKEKDNYVLDCILKHREYLTIV